MVLKEEIDDEVEDDVEGEDGDEEEDANQKIKNEGIRIDPTKVNRMG